MMTLYKAIQVNERANKARSTRLQEFEKARSLIADAPRYADLLRREHERLLAGPRIQCVSMARSFPGKQAQSLEKLVTLLDISPLPYAEDVGESWDQYRDAAKAYRSVNRSIALRYDKGLACYALTAEDNISYVAFSLGAVFGPVAIAASVTTLAQKLPKAMEPHTLSEKILSTSMLAGFFGVLAIAGVTAAAGVSYILLDTYCSKNPHLKLADALEQRAASVLKTYTEAR